VMMAACGRRAWRAVLMLGLALAGLAGCGGSGSGNPLDNPPLVTNSAGGGGQSLSFAYFERCLYPIFAPSPTTPNQLPANRVCSNSGCHADATGTGGAFRIIRNAAFQDVTNPAITPDIIRASDMYKNFYSTEGETIVNDPLQSLLINKPLLRNVLHGGGLIFSDPQDPHLLLMQYWISHPMPAGQDEFSVAGYNLFTPADPVNGVCNTN